jgi:uncharacterized protein (TIGR00290 family)
MRAWLAWSSGKDSAWALHVLRHTAGVEVAGLLCTFNEAFDRVAMHGVRRLLVERQAAACGLPLHSVFLPWPCPNEVYEARMAEACRHASAGRIEAIAFGDLFLRDVRAYRERQMASTGLELLFPLWERPTGALAREMIAGGQRAYVMSVDLSRLDRSWAGREVDTAFLDALPAPIDPCGENGEFHTFVFASPEFSAPLDVAVGEVVVREGFAFADLLSR